MTKTRFLMKQMRRYAKIRFLTLKVSKLSGKKSLHNLADKIKNAGIFFYLGSFCQLFLFKNFASPLKVSHSKISIS